MPKKNKDRPPLSKFMDLFKTPPDNDDLLAAGDEDEDIVDDVEEELTTEKIIHDNRATLEQGSILLNVAIESKDEPPAKSDETIPEKQEKEDNSPYAATTIAQKIYSAIKENPSVTLSSSKLLSEIKQDFSMGKTEDLSALLHDTLEKLANRHSSLPFVFEEDSKLPRVRVFNGNQGFQPDEVFFYERGLQHAQAALKIAQLENLPLDEGKISSHIYQYTSELKKIQTNPPSAKSLKQAQDKTLDFIRVMADEIAQARATQAAGKTSTEELTLAEHQKQAYLDLPKMVQILNAIEPAEDIRCTYYQDDTGNLTLQMSERLTFTNTMTLEQVRKTAWYQQNTEKYGPWFINLMNNPENFKKIMQASFDSDIRDMPNPANAWREHTYHFNEKQVLQYEQQFTRMAISSPLDIKNEDKQAQHAARVSEATGSMGKILSSLEQDKMKETYKEKWGKLVGEPLPPLPILHQTLVNPILPADANMLKVKSEANASIKSNLNPDFVLLETNNCVNMWGFLTKNDSHDSEQLINLTVVPLLTALQKVTESYDADMESASNPGLPALINYLNNPNPTSFPQKEMDEICNRLYLGKFDTQIMDLQTQQELALKIQAAMHLKQLNHESTLSTMGNLWNAIKRASNAAHDSIPKPFTFLRALIPTPTFSVKNKQTYKSAYEIILCDKGTGARIGGCKSAKDREGEVQNNANAMVEQFHVNNGQLIGYSASAAKHNNYFETVRKFENAGHQNVMATDGRKMWETSPAQYAKLPRDVKTQHKTTSDMRKISAKKIARRKDTAAYDKAYETTKDLKKSYTPSISSPEAEPVTPAFTSQQKHQPAPPASSPQPASEKKPKPGNRGSST